MVTVVSPNGERLEMPRRRWEIRRNSAPWRKWQEVKDQIGKVAEMIAPPTVKEKLTVQASEAPIERPRKPRIAHVTPWQFGIGGVQRMISEWCAVEGDKWDVAVFAPPTPDKIFTRFALSCATLHEVAGRDVLAAMKEFDPDVVVHHGSHNEYGRYVPQSGTVVWVIHGEAPLKARKPTWVEPCAIFSNFEPDKNQIDPSWPKLTAVRLGADLDRFKPRRLVAGIVGRLSPEKVPVSFVEKLLGWGNPNNAWEIRFIGLGATNPHQQWAQKIAAGSEWVTFSGDVVPDDMPATYQALDVLLVPSRTETGSYAIAEAMACGVPVIARRVGGVPFTTAGAALLCDTDDEILQSLESLENPVTRSVAARAARSTAETHLDLTRHIDAHNASYCAAMIPKVSILIPVYNTPGDWLLETWRSIQDQTFRAWECVIVDDGSTRDDTLAAMAEIERDPRVRVVRMPQNAGISAALNTGIEACRCELIARMDGDDVMLPERLERQVSYMAEHHECDVLGAQIEMFGPKIKPGRRTEHQSVVTLERMRSTMWEMNHPTVMFRKPKIVGLGGYDETLYRAEDLDLWFRCLLGGLALHNLPEILVRYRCSGEQNSASQLQLDTVEMLREKYAE